jgi:cytochrome c-type biogenesis protein CcmF
VMWRRVRLPLQIAAAVTAGCVVLGVRPITVLITIAVATFVVAGILRHAHEVVWSRPGSWFQEVRRLPGSDPGYWGGMIAHVGVALVAVAIAFSGSFGARQEITLAVGDSAPFEGYTLTYRSPFLRQEPNRTVIGASIELRRGDALLGTLEPRLNQYPNQVQAIPTPSVRTGIREDVYLSLVRIQQDSATVSVDAFRFPLMWLLWTGGLIVFLGGLTAYAGGRRPARRVSEAVDV